MKIPTIECGTCLNTGQVNASVRQVDGSYKDEVIDCPSGGHLSEKESWESLCFMIGQFVRCRRDGMMDPENPINWGCDGCQVEREELLDHVIHFAQAFRRERKEVA